MTRLSIITPTLGRAGLARLLDYWHDHLGPDDQAIVVADGPCRAARELFGERDHRHHYYEYGPTRSWGNAQRDWGIRCATGDWLVFMDDDDEPAQDALDVIRAGVAEAPDRPHLFGMENCYANVVDQCAIGTPMFVVPNVGGLPQWADDSSGTSDYAFIRATIALLGGCLRHPGTLVCYPRRWRDVVAA